MNVPVELRALNQWVIWRLEERDGKQTKVPYRADGAGRASSTDLATWDSYAAAVAGAAAHSADGVGFVFSPDDPYVGVDLDEGLPEADRDLIMLALNSYSERSVSGRGLHIILRASLNGNRRRAGGFEVYDQRRFFVMTGDHDDLSPLTIEERQAQLDAVLAEYLPPEPEREKTPGSPQPVDLDDHELLQRMFAASNGHEIRRVWDGDTSAHNGDPSRADLALLAHLAFYTGRDPGRMERMFSASALGQREKWQRDDYRGRTIDKAIAGCTEIYSPAEKQVRPASDAGPTHLDSTSGTGSGSDGASRVPYVVGTQGRDASSPLASPVHSAVCPDPSLAVEEASVFAAVDEASAAPILGDEENTILVAGGANVWYGDGGAGKTTLGLDRACHLCSGRDWLGLPVPNPVRVLWIENEGPRGKFRRKVRAKLDVWDGPALDGRLFVLSQPWARFSFADPNLRRELVNVIGEHEISVVIAGPVTRLGAEGGGTPKEIQTFVDLLELVRADLDRPLAYELIHHENKQGGVSGAWEGATDTLVQVQARGNGHTAINWRKARWAPEIHGKTWKLNWARGEQFETDDTPDTTDDEIAERLLEVVAAAPGGSWNSYDPLLTGQATRKRTIRDQLIADDKLLNAGTEKAMKLYLPGRTEPAQASFELDA